MFPGSVKLTTTLKEHALLIAFGRLPRVSKMVKLFGGGGPKKVDEEPPQQDAGKARGDYDVDDHLLSREDVAERYGVQIDWTNVGASKGLTSGEAEARLKANGPNRLTPPKETLEIIKFLKQFANPLMALLVVAGALTYMAYALQQPRDKNNLILASALIIVVTLTCLMSYWQERSAGNVMGEWALHTSSCSQGVNRVHGQAGDPCCTVN